MKKSKEIVPTSTVASSSASTTSSPLKIASSPVKAIASTESLNGDHRHSIAAKINQIIINTQNIKTSNIVSIDTNNSNSLSASTIPTAAAAAAAAHLPTLSSSLLAATANHANNTTSSQSYQLLFTTVSKSHPRIKYSGLKKSDDKQPVIVEAVVPHLPANQANILDIASIAPIMTPLAASMPTAITIPASTVTLQKNPPQIVSINNSELSPSIKYADIDDIELPDGTKIGYSTDISELKRLQQQQQQQPVSTHNEISNDASYNSNLAEKYSILAATALKNFDFAINESSLNQTNGSITSINNDRLNETASNHENSAEELFACRHCGKKYRWKSTLRRHENDECGNKEPSHQCPYCPYKAKQRGNLGVHVRKHHANMPQLESRRKRKSKE